MAVKMNLTKLEVQRNYYSLPTCGIGHLLWHLFYCNLLILGFNEWPSWDSTPSRNMDSHLNTYVQNVYEKRNHYQEERRLFYVALTRAKKRLFLVYQVDSPSNFLKEIKESPCVDFSNALDKYSFITEGYKKYSRIKTINNVK